jgi:NDP-sugar pyrophosphorylase family protein
MQAVIMVGGSGIRLRPFTYVIPKPLLPIGDETLLENMIRSLNNSGFDEIFLMTSYQHEKFNQCYKYESKYGVSINICHEEEKMGTAGGITSLKGRLDNDFLVLNGDLLVKMDFLNMFNYHRDYKADLTIGVTEFSYRLPYSVVKFNSENTLIEITEKPTQIYNVNSGIYVLNSSLFKMLLKEEYLDMPRLISLAKKNAKKIIKFDIGNCWLDIGQLEDYEKVVHTIEEWNEEHPACRNERLNET